MKKRYLLNREDEDNNSIIPKKKYIVFISSNHGCQGEEIKNDIFVVKNAGISHILWILNVMRSACNLVSFVAVYYLFVGYESAVCDWNDALHMEFSASEGRTRSKENARSYMKTKCMCIVEGTVISFTWNALSKSDPNVIVVFFMARIYGTPKQMNYCLLLYHTTATITRCHIIYLRGIFFEIRANWKTISMWNARSFSFSGS